MPRRRPRAPAAQANAPVALPSLPLHVDAPSPRAGAPPRKAPVASARESDAARRARRRALLTGEAPETAHMAPRRRVSVAQRAAAEQRRLGAGVVSYSLPHDDKRYLLPAPSALRLEQDGSGLIDNWPRSLAPLSQTTPSADTEMASVGAEPHQPAVLSRVQAFLQGELALLGLPPEGPPSEARLQVYRQVFDQLIGDFRTYGPLMVAIKREYEGVLELYSSELSMLQPLRSRLATLRNETAQIRQSLASEHNSETKLLKSEIDRLTADNTALSSTLARVQAERSHLAEQLQLAETNVQLSLEKQHKLSDRLTELQDHDQVNSESLQTRGRVLEALRASLSQVSEELSATLQEVARLKAEREDLVPREDFDEALAKTKALEDELSATSRELSKTEEQAKQRLRELAASTTQLTDATDSLDSARRAWETLGSALPDLELANEADDEARAQKVAEHVAKMGEARKKAAPAAGVSGTKDPLRRALDAGGKYFEGMGTGEGVPRYLRATGRIRNRKLSKRDTERLIRDIWFEKRKHDLDRPKREKLTSFLYIYLQKRFGIASMITEWAYNLHHALQRYAYDADCELFGSILAGSVNEAAYHDQNQRIEALRVGLSKLDHSIEGKKHGRLPKGDVIALLHSLFPGKSTSNWAKLVDALNEEHPGATVHYTTIFSEDRQLDQGRFMEELRDQHLEEWIAYSGDLTRALEARADRLTILTCGQIREAFAAVDPSKPTKEVDGLLAGMFHAKISELIPQRPITLADALRDLFAQPIQRTTPPADDAADHDTDAAG